LASTGSVLLVVDAGDLFFSRPQLAVDALAKEKIKALAMVAGMNLLGVAAMTVGECDLTAGLPFLEALADSARFPFLSVNLVRENGDPVLPPAVVVEKGGLKIGLIGASSAVKGGGGYRFDPLLPALEREVKAMEDKADLVVVLFHGTELDQAAIAAAGLPIDVILQSHVRVQMPTLGRGTAPVATMGIQGKYLNVLTLKVTSPGEPLVDLSEFERNLNYVEKSFERLRRNRPKDKSLEEIYAHDTSVLDRIQFLREREAQARAALEKAANTINLERIPLGKSIKDDPELLALVTAAKAAM